MVNTPPDQDGIGMIWWAARNPPANPTASFSGKTVLVTGSNVGLGFEAALKFATLGASRLILGVRSLRRGEEAKAEICRRTGYEPAMIQIYEVDMGQFASVKAFAAVLLKKETRLDVAVLNAGLAPPSYQLSGEGYEMSFQVNVLSTALLAILLLPQLRRSAELSGEPSHLEFTGSVAHRHLKADTFSTHGNTKLFDQINDKASFTAKRQYAIHKLLIMYVMDGLVQASPPNHNVIITTSCPSLCRTNLGRDFPFIAKVPVGLFQLIFARSAEEGSRTLVSGVALGKEGHGEFWTHDVFYRKGELVTSGLGRSLQQKFWKELVEVLKQHVPDDSEYLVA